MLDQHFDFAAAEGRIYAQWEEAGCFRPSMDTSAEPYCIVIPPPNVTGVLHMGHALNHTLQDVLIRFERMRGKNVLWQPGTDHAGIATQMVVERNLAKEGIDRRDLGRDVFVEKVWEWKAQSGGQIVGQDKRLGVSADWSRERFTMGNPDEPDNQMVQAVRKVFVELYNSVVDPETGETRPRKSADEKGLIYRDKKLVNWDPHFQTAISDLEVESREVNGHFWHLRYPLADGVSYEHPVFDEDGEPAGTETRNYIVVATTRPETMLGDTGVAVHPEDERYAGLVGKHVMLPIVNRRVPIVADEHADPEKGSGAVKITPAHDFNDFEVGERAGLDKLNILTNVAAIVDGAEADLAGIPEAYRGLDRFAAREKVVADFEALELLQEIEAKKIEQPFGDRSGVVIEPWLTDQWYVDAKRLAEEAIRAVREDETRFVPENWEKTYFNWMENIQPWCISRQLWWGHRIPVWYGPDPERLDEYKENPFLARIRIVAESEEDALSQAKSIYGDKARIEIDEYPALGGFVRVETTGEIERVSLVQDQDVLDTWFSSALWPFSTLGWPEETPELKSFYPGAVLVTAFDIIFFWVARMMMMGLYLTKQVPFRDVYIHALVLDEKGQKMSKSKGNAMDPLELVDEFGADALRFSLAVQAAQGRNIRLAKQRIEGYRNFSTKLWNAAKFCQMNECVVWDAADVTPDKVKQPINRWIMGECVKAAREVTEGLEAYRFNEAAGAVYKFVWNVFCDWHLELIKPLLNGEDEDAKAETRRVTGWVLDEILKLLHPFMPFVTEELWDKLSEFGPKRANFLMLTDWPTHGDEMIDAEAASEIQWVIDLIMEVRSLRGDLNVPAGAKVPLTLVDASPESRQRLDTYSGLVTRLARTSRIDMAETAPEKSVQAVLGEATIALEVAELIDLEAETARLAKEIGKLDKDITGIEKKLGNEAFLAKAPEEIVEEQHERLSEAKARKAKLSAALERLSG